MLSAIKIVMVNTTLPANIGAAARAMMTCALSRLCLVAPKHPIDQSSHAHAKGGAQILKHAQLVSSLEEAIADCSIVIAASARCRQLPRPMLSPTTLGSFLGDWHNQNPHASIAIVFGREDRGLTNDELALADYHLQIPANPAYPVLNIASSIQVIGSFIYAHIHSQSDDHTAQENIVHSVRQTWDTPAITQSQKMLLTQKLLELLARHALYAPDDPKELPNRLLRLGARLQLDKKEYALIMAFLHKLHSNQPQNTQR